jgi:hypothetical protein
LTRKGWGTRLFGDAKKFVGDIVKELSGNGGGH